MSQNKIHHNNCMKVSFWRTAFQHFKRYHSGFKERLNNKINHITRAKKSKNSAAEPIEVKDTVKPITLHFAFDPINWICTDPISFLLLSLFLSHGCAASFIFQHLLSSIFLIPFHPTRLLLPAACIISRFFAPLASLRALLVTRFSQSTLYRYLSRLACFYIHPFSSFGSLSLSFSLSRARPVFLTSTGPTTSLINYAFYPP